MTGKTPKSFVDQVIKSSDSPIHFILCRDGQGHIAHYFLKTTPEKLKRLQVSQSAVIDPAAYGVVLASGFGREPTAATKRKLRQEYGYDFDKVCAAHA